MLSTQGTHSDPRKRLPAPAPAVFLDRDGVLVEEIGYLHKPEDIRIVPRSPEAVAALNQAGLPAIIVTNQAGIGRGYYGWPAFHTTQTAIEQQFQATGASFDGLWACAYHPSGVAPWNLDHPFRKPNPGMLLDAAQAMNIDLARSWMVGDKLLDLECAQRAGLAGAILVRTGYGAEMQAHLGTLPAATLPAGSCRLSVCDDLRDAVAQILAHMGLATPVPL